MLPLRMRALRSTLSPAARHRGSSSPALSTSLSSSLSLPSQLATLRLLRHFAFISTSSSTLRRATQNQAAAATATATSTSTSAYDSSYIPPPPSTSAPLQSDIQALKAHFDLPLPRSQPSLPFGSTKQPPRGLFLFPPLTDPSNLVALTERTLVQASAIVERICNAPQDPSGKELRLVVKNLDRLSDVLCGVIDMCELVRNVHPDKEWVAESDRAYETLCSFMNELNTSTGLYESLLQAVSHPHPSPLSAAELKVAQTFISDFERSGIHLPPAARAKFVRLSDSLLSLGRTFLSFASSGPSSTPLVELPDPEKLLAGMGSQFIDSLPRRKRGGSAFVVPGSWEAQMIARYAREGEARRLVYVGGMREDPERVAVLESMLRERAELANVLGKETWADVALTDKMAKNPTNVLGFLSSLAQHHKPSAASDVATLQRLKATTLTGNYYDPSNGSTGHLPPLYAWDRDYFAEKYMSTLAPTSSLPPITPYLSTGTAMAGLSSIFTNLYGISFVPRPVSYGEVWHPSVRRLDVVDENEGTIGVIYCDLFSRPGKPPSAAHYTVRCSRRVDDDDVLGDGLAEGWDESYGGGLEVEGERLKGKEGRYQLPIVVLTTDFGSVDNGRPALLGWNDLETLFHEMGHAIHSMIGRTEFHNVSGTRCATDFVELPSILMEHFVSSPAVLSTFARHYATDEPIPVGLIQAHLGINQSLAALETHGQITMAMLDQKYHCISHSHGSASGDVDSTRIWHDLQREIGVVPPVEGTAWQTQFGHLYGYGATYYSYLFDRAIAGKVWSTLFDTTANANNKSKHTGASAGVGDGEGILSREGGEKLKEKVLKWGGGKDPWVMVGDVIGSGASASKESEEVSRGDERAMEIVGGWMIK
ncbi:mitochondrial intermediate peptidase 2 [Kwoniella heveanensis BCC8398]|uniref:Mitochondrial intermediate peptidase 1 n=1 Tax=Kwoniella heveanensis BCC8398 TaxID=1296120 RepID=A0A1B9GZV3_9TREE|nr:mitochondrial intermediate peptidase 2 [Kwoniella heveanensis BCC8398]